MMRFVRFVVGVATAVAAASAMAATVWQGKTSTDLADATNWHNGLYPESDTNGEGQFNSTYADPLELISAQTLTMYRIRFTGVNTYITLNLGKDNVFQAYDRMFCEGAKVTLTNGTLTTRSDVGDGRFLMGDGTGSGVLTVDGPDAKLIIPRSSVCVGQNKGDCWFILKNGGYFKGGLATSASAGGSGTNTILITGVATTSIVDRAFNFGNHKPTSDEDYDRIIVTDQAYCEIQGAQSYVGAYSSLDWGGRAEMTISDGAVLNALPMSGNFTIGRVSSSNLVQVVNGGKAYFGTLWLGSGDYVNKAKGLAALGLDVVGNTFKVSGEGSYAKANLVTIGNNHMSGSQFIVEDKGCFYKAAASSQDIFASSNGLIRVASGGLMSIPGTAIFNSTATRNNVDIDGGTLLVTNTISSAGSFSFGQAGSGEYVVRNDGLLAVTNYNLMLTESSGSVVSNTLKILSGGKVALGNVEMRIGSGDYSGYGAVYMDGGELEVAGITRTAGIIVGRGNYSRDNAFIASNSRIFLTNALFGAAVNTGPSNAFVRLDKGTQMEVLNASVSLGTGAGARNVHMEMDNALLSVRSTTTNLAYTFSTLSRSNEGSLTLDNGSQLILSNVNFTVGSSSGQNLAFNIRNGSTFEIQRRQGDAYDALAFQLAASPKTEITMDRGNFISPYYRFITGQSANADETKWRVLNGSTVDVHRIIIGCTNGSQSNLFEVCDSTVKVGNSLASSYEGTTEGYDEVWIHGTNSQIAASEFVPRKNCTLRMSVPKKGIVRPMIRTGKIEWNNTGSESSRPYDRNRGKFIVEVDKDCRPGRYVLAENYVRDFAYTKIPDIQLVTECPGAKVLTEARKITLVVPGGLCIFVQ